ncbi:hypothetical protein DMB66_57500 [Actinoplanes sp. ATCC 53533]|uniref:RICIN domain-containing protein n=1 Tax=Actinoplanes sp. ATCC 53533 TaxID=1288362 RepID=UPI000F7A2C46|nr:RICIN domain-containing protein [Actinoplanes sp. ATCC 53533]RSM40132.1 hypothetical protein DMB66_57500 [Actinoplanes sp. ATCC 53533]
MADDSEREDPVLVRPYITTQPGGGIAGHDDRPAQTWPAAAALPEDGTRELPRVAEPATVVDSAAKSAVLRRQRLIVLAGIGALALLGGAGLYLVLPSGDGNPPAAARTAPPEPGVSGSLAAAAPVASEATRRASPGSSAASRTPVTSKPVTSSAPAVAGQAANTTPASGGPSATLAPPPGTARTGPITAAGGRCLTLGGLFAVDGAPVRTSGCSGVSYQQWTLASDGTLLVVDWCAEVRADEARIGGCDGRPAAQWRAGPNGSLVNPETGRCLTDPGSLGATVTVTACTGAADQAWKLP